MEFYGIIIFNVKGKMKIWLRGAERVFCPSGARAQRGLVERGGKKPRGRGLGQRNTGFEKKLQKKNKKEKKQV